MLQHCIGNGNLEESEIPILRCKAFITLSHVHEAETAAKFSINGDGTTVHGSSHRSALLTVISHAIEAMVLAIRESLPTQLVVDSLQAVYDSSVVAINDKECRTTLLPQLFSILKMVCYFALTPCTHSF